MTQMGSPLTIAALWGSDHENLGEIAVQTIGDSVALALSRGRFAKTYPYVDKNEDAVAAATDGGSWLLVAADGHSGFDAARAAVRAIVEQAEPLLERAPQEPELAVSNAFEAARDAIARAVREETEPRRSSRTALSVVLGGEGWICAATRGDTVVVRLSGGEAELLTKRVEFLGPDTDLSGLGLANASWERGETILMASDGLYDFLGRGWLEQLGLLAVANRTSETLVRKAIEIGFAGGSSDNLAVVAALRP